jgi:hypothetical protein
MSDEELERVSGGFDPQPDPPSDRRTYTLLSNIMDTKEDTVKNSESNIR